MLVGACSSKQSIPDPIECTPEIIVEKAMVPVPAELTQIWRNPAVPSTGDNAALLDWAQTCAVTTQLYIDQMKELKELE